MRYNKLGRSGLFVSELCFGAMTFGGGDGMWAKIGQVQQDEAERMLGAAFDAGINFVDTADVYAEGLSEQIVGQAIKALPVKREDLVVATKVYGPMGEGANSRGASRAHVIEGCKASLKRMQLDYIDLYQIHGFDAATPIEETLRALDVLVQHGHVRYVGVSNWAAWQIMKALGVTRAQHLAPVETVQAYYSLAGRELERELTPMMRSEGVGLLVWSPLAGGFLSGKYSRSGASEQGSRRQAFDFPPVDMDRGHACVDAMRPMAQARGVSVAQIALAWLLHQDVVTSVIVGIKRIEQLHDNLAAVDVQLSPDELTTLDAASRLPPEYPGWMIERQGQRRKQLGDSRHPPKA